MPAGSALERLAQLLVAVPPAPPPPWLDLAGAAQFSGLPARMLQRMAPALRKRGDAIRDMLRQPGEKIRYESRWYFRRGALEGSLALSAGAAAGGHHDGQVDSAVENAIADAEAELGGENIRQLPRRAV
jgi:hypothetical protein